MGCSATRLQTVAVFLVPDWEMKPSYRAAKLHRPILQPMRTKARGLAQYDSPSGWLKESDPAGVILYVMDGPYCLPFPYHTGCLDRSCWNF